MSASLLMLAACGTTNNALNTSSMTGLEASQTKEDVVKAKASAYWRALEDDDYGKAYAMLSEGHRAITSEKTYTSRARLRGWDTVSVYSVKCPAEDRCTVRINIRGPAPMVFGVPQAGQAQPVMVNNYLDTIWLLENGDWRYLPDA